MPFFHSISRGEAEKTNAKSSCHLQLLLLRSYWLIFYTASCSLDVSSVLGWNMSTPRIFMDRGNFLTELDLWGSAEVQLIIPAGVWRLQLASSDAEQLKKRVMARDEF